MLCALVTMQCKAIMYVVYFVPAIQLLRVTVVLVDPENGSIVAVVHGN